MPASGVYADGFSGPFCRLTWHPIGVALVLSQPMKRSFPFFAPCVPELDHVWSIASLHQTRLKTEDMGKSNSWFCAGGCVPIYVNFDVYYLAEPL